MKIYKISKYFMISSLLIGCGFDFKKDKKDDEDQEEREEKEVKCLVGNCENQLNLVATLNSFSSCEIVTQHIRSKLIQSLENERDLQIKYLSSNSGIESSKKETVSAPQADNSPNSASQGPKEHTTTNNQIEGVEEADFVKNTGTHIFQISGKELKIIKSWPADTMELVSTLKLEGEPYELLLAGEKIIAFSRIQDANYDKKSRFGHSYHRFAPMMDLSAPLEGYFHYSYVKASIIDIKDLAKPTIIKSFLIDGQPQHVRRINNTIQFVATNDLFINENLKYPDIYKEELDEDQKIEKIHETFASNKAIIEKTNLNTMLNVDSKELKSCKNIYTPNTSTPLGVTKIISINIDSLARTENYLLSSIDEMFASQQSLYLTTSNYQFVNQSTNKNFTHIHKFNLTNGEAHYTGSGSVEGDVLNQFSMDEYEGNLRVATTITTYKFEDNDSAVSSINWDTVSRVSIFQEKDKKLHLIGKTNDLAKGERIYSARFNGKKAFVVTFKQIDPLFTLDLGDPKNPKVVGELKIPGFSTYIHLIDNEHLLTIGQEDSKIKLSLFSVKDMSKPIELHKLLLDQHAWSSEASYSHKAFTYFAAKKMLAIPISAYSNSSFKSALHLFDVSIEQGIKKYGEVSVSTFNMNELGEDNYNYWSRLAHVSRSIFADDFVYAISDRSIKVVDTKKLSDDVAEVVFEKQ